MSLYPGDPSPYGKGLFSRNTVDNLLSYAQQGTHLFTSIQNAVKGNTNDGTKAKQETVQTYEANSVSNAPKPTGFTLSPTILAMGAAVVLIVVVFLVKKN
jgi:hypothetical protein